MARPSALALAVLIVLFEVHTTFAGEDLRWDYTGPLRVGVVNAVHDWNDDGLFVCESNDHAASEIVSLGLRSVKMMPRVSYLSSEMMSVYSDPQIDVIVLRPLETAAWSQPCPPGGQTGYFWEGPDPDHLIDYGEVAEALYSSPVGDLAKTIILSGWESDWQLRALSCSDIPAPQDVLKFTNILIARQQGIAAARAAHLNKALRIYHGLEVHHVMGAYPHEVIRDIVPLLPEQPDFIAFSAYEIMRPGITMGGALDYIQGLSGLPRNRIIIGEWGWPEDSPGEQYTNLTSQLEAAFNWGVRLAYVWMYRQYWGDDPLVGNLGLWAKGTNGQFTGDLNSGYLALAHLRRTYEDCTSGACDLLAWECGNGIWCNQAFSCGSEVFCNQTVDYGTCQGAAVCTGFRCNCLGTEWKWRSDYYGQSPWVPPDQPSSPVCLGDRSCLYSNGSFAPPGSLTGGNAWVCSWASLDGRNQGVWYQCEQTRAGAGSVIQGYTCVLQGRGYAWVALAQIFSDGFETGNTTRWFGTSP